MLRRTWLRNACAALTGLLASGKTKATTPRPFPDYCSDNVTIHGFGGSTVGRIINVHIQPEFVGDIERARSAMRQHVAVVEAVADFLRQLP